MSQESASIAHVEALDGLQESPNIVEDSAAALISRIEDIIEDVMDSLQENRPLSISIRSRRTGRESAVVFPTTSNSGARRFTYLTVLYHCHEALTSGVAITKRYEPVRVAVCSGRFLLLTRRCRYMFYLNKDLFERQSYVDQIIDDIAFTLGVNRDALNIGDLRSAPISSPGNAVSQNPPNGLFAPDQTVTSSFGHARLPTQLTDVDYKTNALAPSDRRKASNLLRIVEEAAPLEAEEMSLLRELQVMLMLNVKFEIQAISGDGNMTSWLDERLLPGLM
ncbi:hypothetical protein BJ166DRAFT_496108 [Pestalotiopsis sp. NC0098]|nr:hypothetical protein BJ166DRAFT_496108 [Pestalotiopsis sp. NC0098]